MLVWAAGELVFALLLASWATRLAPALQHVPDSSQLSAIRKRSANDTLATPFAAC